MVTLVTDGVIPNTDYKKYIIDTASELSQLETTFGNEAYCIGNATTYICNGSGEYVRKKVAGEDALPGVTSEDDGKALVVKDGHWTDVDLGEEYAKNDGYYEEMSVGNSEQLISNVMVEDTAPYAFRTTGGSADVGDRLYEKIVGGTIAWNQLMSNGNFTSTSSWGHNQCDVSAADNIGTFTANRADQNSRSFGGYRSIPVPVGHYVLVKASFAVHTSNQPTQVSLLTGSSRPFADIVGNNQQAAPRNDQWYDLSFIAVANDSTYNAPYVTIYCAFSSPSDITAGTDTLQLRNVMEFDLTQMFGPTIAANIHQLEQDNLGAGVALFSSLFPNVYYAYNTGELMSVKAAAHKMVGFNALNPETFVKNPSTVVSSRIKVVGGQTYELRWDNTLSNVYGYIVEYDSNQTQILNKYSTTGSLIRILSQETAYVKIQFWRSGGGAITIEQVLSEHPCFHLVGSGYRNGEYEEYKERVYPLDSSLELRGVSKLDASNNLYYDGDTYDSDGTVVRKFGVLRIGASNNITMTSPENHLFMILLPGAELPPTAEARRVDIVSTFFPADTVNAVSAATNNLTIKRYPSSGNCFAIIRDNSSDDVASFKSKWANCEICYKLAQPTVTQANPFQSPQVVNDFGTEEYVDYGVQQEERDVSIPVGHESKYPANLRDKLQHLPDLPNPLMDGNYKIRVDGHQMSLTPDSGGGDTVDVVLSYVEEEPTVYAANMTNGEIIDAIQSGATVRLIFEIPQFYSGWHYVAMVCVGGIGEIDGTRVSDFFAQMIDPYENALVMLNTGPAADDGADWRMSFYPIENESNQLDVTFEGYANLVTGDYSWVCDTYNDEIIDSLTAGKIVRAIVSVDNLPGYTMYFTQASNLQGYASFYGTALLELNGSNVLCYFQLYQNNEDSWVSIITPLNT